MTPLEAYKLGMSDAERVCFDWLRYYEKQHKTAMTNKYKEAFYLCTNAIENVLASMKKLEPPPEVKPNEV